MRLLTSVTIAATLPNMTPEFAGVRRDDDIQSMIDFELDLWQQSPANETLLKFYLEQDHMLRELRPEYEGWFSRIDEHPQIAAEELTAAHGNLIALGYLKVDIAGRSSGVRYQITTAGKRQLDLVLAIVGNDDDDEQDGIEPIDAE